MPSNLCWRIRHLLTLRLKTEQVHPKGSEMAIHFSVSSFPPPGISLQELKCRCQNIIDASRDNFPAVSLDNAKAAHSPWVSFHVHAQNSQFRNHKHPVLTLRSAQSSHTQAPNSWNVKMGKKLNESSSYSDFFLKLLLVSSKIVRTFVEGVTTTWLMLKMSQTFGGVCGD